MFIYFDIYSEMSEWMSFIKFVSYKIVIFGIELKYEDESN